MSSLSSGAPAALERKEEIASVLDEVKADGSQFGAWREKVIQTLEVSLQRPNSFVVVNRGFDGVLQGVASGYIDRHEAVTWWTILADSVRGNGVGGKMKGFMTAFLRVKQVDTIRSTAETPEGKRMLERDGYTSKDGSHYSKWIGLS